MFLTFFKSNLLKELHKKQKNKKEMPFYFLFLFSGNSVWSDHTGHEPGVLVVQPRGPHALLTQPLQHARLILIRR